MYSWSRPTDPTKGSCLCCSIDLKPRLSVLNLYVRQEEEVSNFWVTNLIRSECERGQWKREHQYDLIELKICHLTKCSLQTRSSQSPAGVGRLGTWLGRNCGSKSMVRCKAREIENSLFDSEKRKLHNQGRALVWEETVAPSCWIEGST